MTPRTVRIGYRRVLQAADAAWAVVAAAVGDVLPVAGPILAERGAVPLGPRVVVFCHFDRKGRVAEHARRYLDAIRQADLSIVFVSNAELLDRDSNAWLHERCSWVAVRPNRGLDFAAWRDGLLVAGLPRAETELLVFANDSVYGPVSPLEPLLQRMRPDVADVWALTESWQHRYHLQSFFLAFMPAAFRAAAFARFWRGVRDLPSKTAIIRRYEIGLTQQLLDTGLRCRAMWPYVDLIAGLAAQDTVDEQRNDDLRAETDRRNAHAVARRRPLNPTAELWRPLLAAGFPFVKRELLRSNPAAVADVAAWLELVRAVSPAEADVIIRDLARSLRNLTP